MKYNVLQDAISKNKSHKRKHNWQKVVTFMAAIVVFCTTYALILPAITMSAPLTCGQEEHIHTQDCYVMIGETPRLTCDKAEHAHDDVLCYIDTEADVETASTWEGTLPKQLSGVYANDLVAIAESQLGYTESVRNIVIGEDNTLQGYTRYGAWAGEKYGDWNSTFLAFVLEYAGLTEEEYPRSVNCELWKSTLEAEELFHTLREGYLPIAGDILFLDTDGDAAADRVGLVTGVTTDESGVLEVLAIEGNAGSSDRKLNETAVMALSLQLPEAVSDSDDTVSGNDAAVSAGDSSLGENSYPSHMTQISSPEGYKGGCVDSTSYLLSDERIVGFATMPEQTFYCLKEGHVHTDLCYMQKLNCKITAQDHIHSALCYERGDQLCEKEEHVHTQECSQLPAYVYHYEDEQVQVEVEIPEECGVPADAELIVTAIGEEHTGYASLVQEAEAAIEGNVAGIQLYDISFYTTEGTYLPVSDRAKVVIRFKEQVVDPTAEVAVLHYDEYDTSARVLENVTIEEQAVTVKTGSKIEEDAQAISLFSLFSARETVPQEEEITEERVLDENGEVVTETVVTFETDGFSTFAVVQVETGVYTGTIYTPQTSGFTIDGHNALTNIVNSGKQFMIVTADKKYALSGYAYLDGNGNDKLRGMQVLDTNTEGENDQIYVNANKHLLWEFLPTDHKGRVYIRNVATGEYLQLVRNNVAITTQLLSEEEFKNQQMIYAMKDNAADSNIVAFCAVNNTQDVGATANGIAGVDYYYLNRDGGGDKFHTWQGNFVDANNQFLLYEYTGKDNEYEQGDPTVTYIVNNDRVNNLAGMTLVISSDIAAYTMSSEEFIVTSDGSQNYIHRAGIDMTKDVAAGTVTVSSLDKVQWEFVTGNNANKQNDYYIKVKDSNPALYLNVSATGQIVNISANPQNIYVNAVANTGYAVTLRTEDDKGRRLAFNADGNHSFASYNTPQNKAENLILSEVRKEVLATDLGGKTAYIVAVNNVGNGAQPAVASQTGKTAVRIPQGIVNGGDFDPAGVDPDGILGWYFEQTDTPGVYHLIATSGANVGKYMTFVESVNGNQDFAMTDTPQDIEVLKADTSGNNLALTEYVISLRAELDGKYYYLHLGNNNPNSVNAGFQCKAEGQNNFTVAATHFRLVEIPKVNEVVDKINTLLDNMVQNADGSWKFSAAGLTGSAAPGNANTNQGNYSNNYQQPFIDNYDQAQAYRREQQLLARKIRELYAELTPAEQRYVWRYEIIDSNGNDEDDLRWLWDEVKVVTPNSPAGVKVELFNYDESVNNTGLAFGRGDKSTEGGDKDSYNDPKGFTFYHKIQYDEYTMMDSGRDEIRTDGKFGGTLGSDDKALYMAPKLDADGYPVITGGANAANEFKTDNNGGTGSLKYLFDPEGKYHVATMTDGGGLFQKDEKGYYYYYANQNAAYYSGTVGPVDTDGDGIADKTKVEDGGHFILYDTVIRPMYVHGYQPPNANDVYNFLPFNNPYDNLIFDEPNTIPSNTIGVANKDENGNDRVNTNEKKYEGGADNTANIARSGYLNERVDLWFGMTIELEFLMPENGQLYYYNENNELDHVEDMLFDFYGDDDVWVYIDDQLVLDIGGVHGAEKGNINFHTGAVYYEDSSSQPTNTTLAEIFAGSGVELNGNTFADYTKHTLKFFYMERGGNVSYCGLKFNMPTLPVNYLMVDKQLAELVDGEVIDADVIGDKYYTFRVVQANADGKPIDKDGNVTDKVKDMVPFFEPYASFEVYRGGAPTGIVGKTSEDGFFSVKAGYQAVFSDMLNHRRDETKTHYVVQEILFDGDMEQLEYITYKVSSLGENTGTQGQEFQPDIKRDDLGIFMGEVIFGAAYTNGVDAGDSSSIRFTNVLKAPDSKLAIIKKLGEGVDESQYPDTEFTVKLEFGDYAIMETAESTEDQPEVERGMIYSPVAQGTPYTLYDKDGKVILTEEGNDFWEVASTDGTITLKPGQKAVFDGIVAGTYYRVSEQLAESDSWMPTYTGKIYELNKDGTIASGPTDVEYPEGNANGRFDYPDYVEITIENTNYTVSVEIPLKKYVEYASMTDNFTFNVQWVRMKDEDNDGKLDQGATYDLNWVNTLINDTTKTDAQKYYSLPGANITVTPEMAALGADGKVIIGFPDTSLTNGHAYYKISEQQGKGSYLYDTNYYIVEVTLNKDAANAADKAKITGIWKNGTGENLVPGGNAGIAVLDFVNHRTTSLEVSKEVENSNTSDTFEFEYIIRYPDIEAVYKTGTFILKNNEKHSITGIPVGAIVEVTEKDAEGYLPYYNVTAVYEAEYAKVEGAAVVYNEAASAGAYVGNIKGDTQIVAIPVYTKQGIGVDINFRYAQQASRKFFVNNSLDELPGITYTFASTGGWANWNDGVVYSGPYMNPGENSLVIGGVDGADAPNLDQIKLIFGRVQGDTAAVNILGDGSAIHFVNKPAADVTVSKTVVGSDLSGEFTFVATIKDAVGNPLTSVTTGDGVVLKNSDGKYEFKLTNEASLVFKKLPIGATIQVEETGKGNAISTYYRMTTRIEAEDGTLHGENTHIYPDGDPSGGYFVGNIKGNTNTVTIPVQVKNIAIHALQVGYGTAANRDLVITNDSNADDETKSVTLEGLNSGGWWTWKETSAKDSTKITLVSGNNRLIFGGSVNGEMQNDAPNLDYIALVWEGSGTNTEEEYINGNMQIHFTNEAGYELPESGGFGTTPYILGGIFTMLTAFVALLLYKKESGLIQRPGEPKRRKEERVPS